MNEEEIKLTKTSCILIKHFGADLIKDANTVLACNILSKKRTKTIEKIKQDITEMLNVLSNET